MVHLVLEHTGGEVQQLQVCVDELLLSLVAHHDLSGSWDEQPQSRIAAAFLPFLQGLLRMVDNAWIQVRIIGSMPQLCVLVPFTWLQELLLEDDECLPTLTHHRSGKRGQAVIHCDVSQVVLDAGVPAVVDWLCLEDL